MPFHRRSIHRSVPRARKWEWIYSQNNMTSAAGNAVDVLSAFRTKMTIGANLPDTTVVRIRGTITIQQAAASALSYTSGIIAAFLVFPLTTAAGNIPNPSTDPFNDWLFWRAITPFEQTATGASASLANAWIFEHELDIKAMRRLKNVDDTLWFTYAQADASNYAVKLNIGVGVKLP